jgi:hypothetical protein
MPTLEYLVRPWQARDAQGRIIIPSTPVGTHERATIQWGANGTVPTPQNLGPAGGVSCCSDQSQEETDQKYDAVSVTNAGSGDDAGESISFQRAKSFSYKKKTEDKCASNWDQFSGIGMEITGALDEFAANILDSETLNIDVPTQSCQGTMDLTNTG